MFVLGFVKIGQLIETFTRSYTQARAHGDDHHKILLIYVFSFYFCFFKRKRLFAAQSTPRSERPPSDHGHQLVYFVSHMVCMLHLAAHIEVLCLKELTYAEQKMTLAQSVFRTELKR
jgi:hypothetical protein